MNDVRTGNGAVRRTTRGARTRERLIDAAAELVAREPSATIGLDRIARAAGVAKSSVLWHFGSKEQLYLAVAERWFSSFQHSITAELGSGRELRDVLPGLLDAYAAFLDRHPEANVVLFSLLFGAPKDSDLRPRIAEMYREFRHGIRAHTRSGEKPVSETDASLIIALLDGVFIQGFIDPQRSDHHTAFDRIKELLASQDTAPGGTP